ncbi:guanitoxin biosynthesis heme-dependent pre-guanitoxin N-hydroxylase GntA [soil metagenome]
MAQNPFSASAEPDNRGLAPGNDGGFVPSRVAAERTSDPFLHIAHAAFRDLVTREDYPCVGARAALNSGSYALATYDELGSAAATTTLAADLWEFTRSEIRQASEYATFVAVFRQPRENDEKDFERLLWQQLAKLNRLDASHFNYDPEVSSDPGDPQFSFSFAGQSLYVIGMHPRSSREARRFAYPMLVFNPHEQFERLRAEGKWKRMQQTIRERDLQLQGSINPMLSDFGQVTEARQYSGRAVEEDWRAPFEPAKSVAAGKCPFGHG